MPGTNLTRDEAATRAALLDVTSYTVDLDLTTGPEPDEQGPSGPRPRSRSPAASRAARPSPTWSTRRSTRSRSTGGRSTPRRRTPTAGSQLDDLAGRQRARRARRLPYSHTGEGLHRFVDPADDRVYLYTQFEVPDARRVYTTFEQPDLKSVFTFTVTAPEHWKVVSNAPTPEPDGAGDGKAVWRFPTTERMSTYITAIVAGEYHEALDTYEGKHGTIPLGPLLPPVAGRAPRHRRARRAHQAGLRVLRGGVRLPLPVRQVRPALRAGVQHGRDGERRLRDLARRVPPPLAASRARSTSSAPR